MILGAETQKCCSIGDKIDDILQRIEALIKNGDQTENLPACLAEMKEVALCIREQPCSSIDAWVRKMSWMVETAPSSIVLSDQQGRIEYVNSSLLKNSGFNDASEVVGLSIFDFTSEEGKTKLREEILPALNSVGHWQGELPIIKKDGQLYMVEMICTQVKDDFGHPIYLLANFFNITERKRAEEALLLDDSRLEALQKLNQMDEASLKEITDFALEAGVKLTGSKLGYLAFLDDSEETLFMHSWSKTAMQICKVENKPLVFFLKDTGLWGESVRQRCAVITNDYSSSPMRRGTPAGHVKVIRHMNVPIMDKGKIVVVAGVGNKDREYNDADVRQLTLLMSGMWKIVQRRKAEADLHRRDLLLQSAARATNLLLSSDTQAIEKALGILGEATDVDRVHVLRIEESVAKKPEQDDHIQWYRDAVGPFFGKYSWKDLFPGWEERFVGHSPIQAVSSELSLPARMMLERLSIRSFLLLPVFMEERFHSIICFEDCSKERRWSESETAILQAAAASIGEAILRRSTEKALQESQRALSTLMSNLPGMAYRCHNDRQWTMQFVSDGCLELTGWQAEDLLGNKRVSYADLIHPGDQNYVWNEVQAAISEKRQFRLTYRIRTRSGIKWVWERGQGIFNSQGDVVALEGFINDITERMLAEEALRSSQEELERRVVERTDWLVKANAALQEEMVKHKETERELRQAQQAADAASQAKSEFLANMSHEIRTPMNAVIGLAGLLMETDLTPDQRDYVETIHSSGDALLVIINDILDFSKIDERKMKLERLPFRLKGSIEASCGLVAAKAMEMGLSLTYDIDKRLPEVVLGDPTRLRQVLANLLSNAVKFTDNGSISICVQPGDSEDEIVFSVSDTGIGISPDDQKKLFLSFSQVDASTSRKYGGTGLGLAISRRLVELMGGRIWVESRLGQGSTFYFKIKAASSNIDIVRANLAVVTRQ